MYTVYVAELVDLIHNDLFDVLQAQAKEAVIGDPQAREAWFEQHFEAALEMVGTLQNQGVQLKFEIDQESGQVQVELSRPGATGPDGTCGISQVFRLCDAYESGFGDSQHNNFEPVNPYPEGSAEAEAYQIGFDVARERMASDIPA